MLWLGCRPVKREEEEDEEMDSFYKHQNFLKCLCTSLIIVHTVKQHEMTPKKLFIKVEDGKADF